MKPAPKRRFLAIWASPRKILVLSWLFLAWFVYEWRWPRMSIDHFVRRVSVRDVVRGRAEVRFPAHVLIRAEVTSFWNQVRPLLTDPPVANLVLGQRGQGPDGTYYLPMDASMRMLIPPEFHRRAVVDLLEVNANIPWSRGFTIRELGMIAQHPAEIDRLDLPDCSKLALRLFAEGKPFVAFVRPVGDQTSTYRDPNAQGRWRVNIHINTSIERCEAL